MGKMLVAVDEDIDIKDAENVLWAIAYRVAALSRHRGGRGAAVHARSGGGAARRLARPGHARQAAALDRAPDRRHHAVGLSAAVAAEARIHGARDRDLAGPATARAQSEGTLVGLFARALDRGRGAGGRSRRAGPSLRDRRESRSRRAASSGSETPINAAIDRGAPPSDQRTCLQYPCRSARATSRHVARDRENAARPLRAP